MLYNHYSSIVKKTIDPKQMMHGRPSIKNDSMT